MLEKVEAFRAALEAIAQDDGCGDYGERNEWTESDAFDRVQRIAREALDANK